MTRATRIHLRYVVGGLLICAFWYLNSDRPPLIEALRTLAVFAALMLVLKVRLRGKPLTLHLGPLLTGKAVLVACAAMLQVALTPLITQAALISGIALGLAVALLGPLGDRWFVTRPGLAAADSAAP